MSEIQGDQGELVSESRGRNDQVMGTDHLAGFREMGPDLSMDSGDVSGVGQHLKGG